jgi:DNA-binding LytR/AlgR family response regulator
MPTPTALIADDEPHLAQHLREQLNALWPELAVLHVARHGLDAAERVAALQPDIAFLDIQMPGLTGLEVAEGIEGNTRVVFVTAYDEFAVRAFEQSALDYVLKPVTTERLARTVQRLKAALATVPPEDGRLAATLQRLQAAQATGSAPLRWIRAGQGDLMHQIDVADVLFFQADEKYTVVRTARAEHVIRTPIAELVAQLDGQSFWQVHRSTLINLAHLAGTRRDEASRLWLRLHGWTGELPVSRAYVHRFKPM